MYSFSKLKVCFVGVGSIASKHINNLIDVCKADNIELTIDALRRNSGSNASEAVKNAMAYVSDVYFDYDSLPKDYDIIFITNPTDLHMEALNRIHDHGSHFFVEKPIISVGRIKEAESFAMRQESVYYVACPLRYTPVLQYIKSNIDTKTVNGVRSISSSYLPDWRPGTDYRKCYSAIKALGGGVAIDLIHEWDYLTWLFDFPKDVKSILSKKSNLEIDTEDYATYIGEYDDKIVELHLDYFGRKTLRDIMIFTDEDTIVGDLVDNSVTYLKEGRKESFEACGPAVGRLELKHFLDIIDGKVQNDNTIMHAIRTLKLTQGIV